MNNKRVEYTRVRSLINSRVVKQLERSGAIGGDGNTEAAEEQTASDKDKDKDKDKEKNTSDIGGGGSTKGEEQDGSTGASVQSSNISEIEEIHREASEEQTVSGQCQIKPR